MSKIKIKQYQLFNITMDGVDLLNVNPALNALLNFKPDGSALRYDIQTKLAKTVDKAIKDFHEVRTSLLDEMSTKKKVKLKNGNTFDTCFQIVEPSKDSTIDGDDFVVEIDGKKIKGNKILGMNYDLGNNEKDFYKKINEMLSLEIELDCYPIKLSKLDKERLPGEVDFGMLEGFIIDDIN